MNESPYLRGLYAPVTEEVTAGNLEVLTGELPRDLEGSFVRNGANPRLSPKGRYHWFDGDGMVHGVELGGGQVTYRNRWVRTPGLAAEREAGEPLWTGILEPIDLGNPHGPFKNTANTDLVHHAGKLLSLWWQTGIPYELSVPALETRGEELFGKNHRRGISAHPKVDPVTGEMMFMTFSPVAPYLSYGVVDALGQLAHFTPIEGVPGARYQHDIAITEHHTILMDLPMYADPEMLKLGKSRVRFFRDQPARFAVIPRHGVSADVRWFDFDACYIYHTINAWEDGDEIVLVGCRIADPLVGDPQNPARDVPAIGLQRLEPRLWEWRMNLRTGATKETALGDQLREFPRTDNRRLGRRTRYSYLPAIADAPTLLFDGLVKHDHDTGRETSYAYPKGTFGGEAVVCPRVGSTEEDDAYLCTFTANGAGESALYVWSARDFGEPLATVRLPQRVPIGYHAYWVPA